MSKQILEEGWTKIFEKYIDVSKDLNIISTKQIKSIAKQDLRLMTKFDSFEDQPKVFKDNGFILLPLTNGGDFALVRGKSFENVNYIEAEIFHSRLGYDLDTLSQGISESQHIDYAYHSGLIEHFLNIDGLHLTIRGRKYTPEFSFCVGKVKLKVKGVQFEVDSGFQNKDAIALLEAKIGKPSDFNIRQLFYPYRSWKIWGKNKDKFFNIFFTFNPKDKTYGLWLYEFKDDNQYESIKLVKKGIYKIINPEENRISLKEISEMKEKTEVVQEWDIPQADDFEKIALFPFKVASGINNSNSIAESFKFTTRQSSYYRHATESLGLVKLKGNEYILTKIGEKYIKLPTIQRNALLSHLILQLPIVDEVNSTLSKQNQITLIEIAEIINKNTKYNKNTSLRRAKTIISWFKWIEKNLGIVKVEKTKVSIQ